MIGPLGSDSIFKEQRAGNDEAHMAGQQPYNHEFILLYYKKIIKQNQAQENNRKHERS